MKTHPATLAELAEIVARHYGIERPDDAELIDNKEELVEIVPPPRWMTMRDPTPVFNELRANHAKAEQERARIWNARKTG